MAVDYDDAFADALRDEVVAVSFAVVYGRSNAAFDPKALALADLDPWVGILQKSIQRYTFSKNKKMFSYYIKILSTDPVYIHEYMEIKRKKKQKKSI